MTIRVIKPAGPIAATPPVAPVVMAPASTHPDLGPPMIAIAASAVASAASGSVTIIRAASARPITNETTEGDAFSIGRLLDMFGIPLEAGNDAPDRNYTGANTLPLAPDYLTAQQFEIGPKPQGDIVPIYPENADGRSGSVVLRLLLGADGTVDNVAVIQAMPAGVFDAAAILAFISARFAPAMLHGEPVKSQIAIEVQFAPVEHAGPFWPEPR